jgi:hypothetical protein
MKNKLTLEQHIENADDLAIACHHLSIIFFRCQNHYAKSSPLMKALCRVLPQQLGGIFTKIKSMLDDDFHKLISNEQFGELGHIYYNLEDRYTKIKNDL